MKDIERGEYSRGVIGMRSCHNLESLCSVIESNHYLKRAKVNSSVVSMVKEFIQKLAYNINPVIHSLSVLQELSQLYITNEFVAHLSEQFKKKYNNSREVYESEGEFTLAFAHTLKTLWCSPPQMESIRNCNLVKEFIKQKLAVVFPYSQEIPHIHQALNPSPCQTLSETLSYLHEDLCELPPPLQQAQLSQPSSTKYPFFFSSFEALQNYIRSDTKAPVSKIHDLFAFTSYNLEVCSNCRTQLGYRFVPGFMVNIDLPQSEVETLKLFFVHGSCEVTNKNESPINYNDQRSGEQRNPNQSAMP
jgi:hypothetical protein